MRRPSTRSFLLSIACALALLTLSAGVSSTVRGGFMAVFSPVCKGFSWVKTCATAPVRAIKPRKIIGPDGKARNAYDEAQRLSLENLQLSNELDYLRQVVAQYQDSHQSDNINRSLPAQVIFRSPNSWSNSLWINVGAAHNAKDSDPILTINSPVVIGQSLVGVVDYVGWRQSRVQLITDSRLHPSVRVLRDQDFLAKGEIHGSSAPLWRCAGQTLKGIGFNYDYPDAYSASRDLRTGQEAGDSGRYGTLSLVKEGDLLVSTGMDGIFPPGLQVAKVTKVHPLHEGSYSFSLEAEPSAGNLLDLSTVFIIPARSASPQDFDIGPL